METTQMSFRDAGVNTVEVVCTMKYYLALKRSDVLIRATTWVSLEDVTLRERSQTPKDRYDATYRRSPE